MLQLRRSAAKYERENQTGLPCRFGVHLEGQMDPGGEKESEQRVYELGVQMVTEPREVSRRPEACITRGPCVGNVPGKLLRRCHRSPSRSRQAWGCPRSGAPTALVFMGVCALHHMEGSSMLSPNSSISPCFLDLYLVTQGWAVY